MQLVLRTHILNDERGVRVEEVLSSPNFPQHILHCALEGGTKETERETEKERQQKRNREGEMEGQTGTERR